MANVNVKLLRGVIVNGQAHTAGETVTVSAGDAAMLINLHKAAPVTGKAAETATDPKATKATKGK